MSRARRCSFALLVALAASSFAPCAFAKTTLAVELVLAPCMANDGAGIERVVQAELGRAIAVSTMPESEHPLPASPDVARVRVSCAEATIELEVQDPVTGKKLSRHVQIPPDLAAARARVLGLSVAELVAASWIELSETRTAPVKVVDATASRDTRSAALVAAERGLGTGAAGYELAALAEIDHFTRADLSTWGGGLAAAWLPRPWLELELGATAGNHAVSLGHVNAFLGSFAFGPRLRAVLGRWAFQAGPGMRVGFAHFSGVANGALTPVPEQRSATLPWAGPLLAIGASVRPVGLLDLSAVLEGGLVSYRADARVAGQDEFEIAGPWLSLGLGFGLSGGD